MDSGFILNLAKVGNGSRALQQEEMRRKRSITGPMAVPEDGSDGEDGSGDRTISSS